MVNAFTLTHPNQFIAAPLFVFFQVTPLIILVLIFCLGNKMRRVFSAYTAACFLLMAFLQNISINEKYGLSICLANVITFLLLAYFWLQETISPQNDFTSRRIPAWKYPLIALALFAFWEPVHPVTLLPDFNPLYFLTSGAGLSFCLSAPLYLSVLIVFYPRTNLRLLAATGLAGFILSLGNFFLELVMIPDYWWVGMLHIPLCLISTLSVCLAFKNQPDLDYLREVFRRK